MKCFSLRDNAPRQKLTGIVTALSCCSKEIRSPSSTWTYRLDLLPTTGYWVLLQTHSNDSLVWLRVQEDFDHGTIPKLPALHRGVFPIIDTQRIVATSKGEVDIALGPHRCDASRNFPVMRLAGSVMVKFHRVDMDLCRFREIAVCQEVRRRSFYWKLHVASLMSHK